MAHFAKLDENNVVLEVIVISNDDIQNLPFPQSEAVGIAFLNSFLPAATWKQTSYNSKFRFRYAYVGGTFHAECGEHGGFAHPKLADNFIWDEPTCSWIPPVSYPTDGYFYTWSLDLNKWVPLETNGPPTTYIG